MKKIEQKMIKAIRSRCPATISNTTVVHGYSNPDNGMAVYLHGNHIATLTDTSVRFTLAGWNTVTTRSRVNALLSAFAPAYRVSTQRGQACLYVADERARVIGNDEWVELLLHHAFSTKELQ